MENLKSTHKKIVHVGSFLRQLELVKIGRVRRPKGGSLGQILATFLFRGGSQICREVMPVTISPRRKSTVQVYRNVDFVSYGLGRRNLKRRPIRKISLGGELAPLKDVVAAVKANFEPERRLLALCLDIGSRRDCWVNNDFLGEFQKFESYKDQVDSARNNGGNPSKIRFYEKMLRMEACDVASKLNLEMGSVHETLESVRAELRNFAA